MITRRGKAIVQIIPLSERSSTDGVWSTVAVSRARYGKITDDFELPERNAGSNRSDPLA